MPCYFLQHVLPFCHITQRLLSHLTLASFQAVFLHFGIELSTDRLSSQFRGKAPGSIPIALKYVGGTDKSGQQAFWSGSPPSLSSFAPAPLPSVHPQWSRKNQDPDRQDTRTYTHAHQITQYDWSQAVCLSPLGAMTFQFLASPLCFQLLQCSRFHCLLQSWKSIYFNPYWFLYKQSLLFRPCSVSLGFMPFILSLLLIIIS